MESKEKFEKSVTEKTKIKKETIPELSSKSIDESSLESSLENSDDVLNSHADLTPEKSMEKKKNIEEILVPESVRIIENKESSTTKNINEIVDNASMPMESTPAVGTNQYERFPLIEGIKSSKKMKDIGGSSSSMELTPPVESNQHKRIPLIESIKSSKKMKDIEGNTSSMELTPPIKSAIYQQDPEIERSSNNPSNVAVPREAGSILRALPNFDEPSLVLATHLVPSLPISLFEILVEILEIITGRTVVLLHESRCERPVAKNIVDIAILPIDGDWDEGSLLPVSFVFEHRLNIAKNPGVYIDVVVAQDCVRNIEGIMDLRGYRCALPDRRKALGAAALLFQHLNSKGENPSFFGDTFDSDSQLSTLQMVAGKQMEIGVLESPVIQCHKNTWPGVDSVCVLESLGPLPPYRIMLNKKTQASIREKIIKGLLSIACDDTWMEKLGKFGVLGFAKYNVDHYNLEDLKSVVTSVPYY